MLSGGGLNLFGLLCAQGLQMSFLLVLTNVLGPDRAGVYFLAVAAFGLGSMFCLVGLNWAVIRLSNEQESDAAARVQRTAFGIVAPLSVTVAAALFVFAPQIGSAFGDDRVATLLRIIAPVLPFQALMRMLNSTSQARKQMAPMVFTEKMLQPATLLVVFALSTIFIDDTRLAAVSFAISAVLGFVVALQLARPFLEFGSTRTGFDWPAVKFAGPLALMNVVQFSALQLESLSLGLLGSSADVGVYFLALRVTTFCSIILLAANAIFAPYISQLDAAAETSKLQALYRQVAQAVLGLSLVIGALVFLGGGILSRVAGTGFEEAVPITRVLLLGQLASLIAGPAGLTLTMTGRSHLNLINSVTLLVFQIGLAVALIPRLGILGAAISAAAASVTVNTLRLVQLRRSVGIHPFDRRTFHLLLAAGLCLGLAVVTQTLLGGHTSLVATLIAAIVFVSTYGVAVLTQIATAHERALSIKWLRKARRLQFNAPLQTPHN